ncbi:MAG: hypothetical protein R3F55_00295 [Alphaproteobacteria bacterium]
MKLENFTLTTPGGCTIVVNGDLNLRDKTFKGTVKISGSSCPVTGSFEFRSLRRPAEAGDGRSLTLSFDNDDPAHATKIKWSGNAAVARILNDKAVDGDLRAAVLAAVKPGRH